MNVMDLKIQAGDDALHMRAHGRDAVESLIALGELLGSPASPADRTAEPDAELRSSPTAPPDRIRVLKLHWITLRGRVPGICRNEALPHHGRNRKIEWRMLLALAAARAALDGRQIALLHGVLLGKPYDGTLLFGPSGIGKSTTMRRYRDAGGEGLADDLVLIGSRGGELLARGLPTWKELRRDPAWTLPPRPITRLLCLTRTASEVEPEHLGPIGRDIFLAQLYAALLVHIKYLLAFLPSGEAKRASAAIWELSDRLTDHFSPRALSARPDADLFSTLESS